MGRVLRWKIPENFCDMRFEEDTNHVAQLLDVLIIRRNLQPLPPDVKLPDGLTLDREISLLTYKSHHESLGLWTIHELIDHYVGERKKIAAGQEDRALPDKNQFALYAVTAMYPEALIKQVNKADWQPTAQVGVYHLFGFGLQITVIVTSQIPTAPHNIPWNLLSNKPQNIDYAMNQAPLPEDLQPYFAQILQELG
jgi:hypothetical protein